MALAGDGNGGVQSRSSVGVVGRLKCWTKQTNKLEKYRLSGSHQHRTRKYKFQNCLNISSI